MPLIPPRLLRALDSFNAAHPWSHNAYYHPWLLRQLPRYTLVWRKGAV